MTDNFSQQFLNDSIEIIKKIPSQKIEFIASELREVRDNGGRLFFLGVGGSAGNCGHAVNDFRKICGFEAYAPTDNVSELTARTNDEGWSGIFSGWLETSKLNQNDAIFILSVGGGNLKKNVSPNLVEAINLAKKRGSKILGIVGRDGGYTAQSSDSVVIIPTVNPAHVTPQSEAFQGIVWHLLVTHPLLKKAETKWESTK
ncbi:MAG: SIS domain-containing protein [Halobacteriovoraceae bacterium]|nr:SIS domain-containing protein [Halobacteriovoraceae bacterium]